MQGGKKASMLAFVAVRVITTPNIVGVDFLGVETNPAAVCSARRPRVNLSEKSFSPERKSSKLIVKTGANSSQEFRLTEQLVAVGHKLNREKTNHRKPSLRPKNLNVES